MVEGFEGGEEREFVSLDGSQAFRASLKRSNTWISLPRLRTRLRRSIGLLPQLTASYPRENSDLNLFPHLQIYS